MLAKLLADFLKAAVFFEGFEVMSAPAHRFALCDDDSRRGANNYLLAGVTRLLFRVVTFALLFVLGLTLLLFHAINDERQFGISFFEFFNGTDALAAPLLLFVGERKAFASCLPMRRQDRFK